MEHTTFTLTTDGSHASVQCGCRPGPWKKNLLPALFTAFLFLEASAASHVPASPPATPTASYMRSGSDRITSATLPAIGTVTPTYDATYGNVTMLTGSARPSGNANSLSYVHDPFSGKLLSQTLTQTTSGNVKTIQFNANMTYDAFGRRIRRAVDGGQLSPTTGSDDSWYGPMLLKPMVVSRTIGDLGQTARIIYISDKTVAIDTLAGTPAPTYPVTDHLGSARATLTAAGAVHSSASYDDWGKTAIVGQESAVDDTDLDMLFRYQGIEQELYPLTRLGVVNGETLAWLDGIGQYHYYGREYAAGLASFVEVDPAGSSVSPYAAFASDPANFIDPDGMAAKLASDSLEAFVKHMRQGGIQKIFVGEIHPHDQYSAGKQSYNFDMVSRVLAGASAGGAFKFWRELNMPADQEAMVEDEMKRFKKNRRHFIIENLALDISGADELKPAFLRSNEYKRFNTALLKKNAAVAPIFFHNARRADLTSFVNAQDFGIANMGIAHAEYSYLPRIKMAFVPWSSTTDPLPGTYANLNATKQAEIFYGFRRALALAPSGVMLIRPGTVYTLDDKDHRHHRSTILNYYRNEGFAVLEYPVIKNYNVTVIAPAALTSHILDFIRNMTSADTVNFNCTGLPGCEPPPAEPPAPDRDEL